MEMFGMIGGRFEVWGLTLVRIWGGYLGSFSLFLLKSSHANIV